MNIGTGDLVKAAVLGLKGSLMLYVLGSILFIASFIVAITVILTQVARYRNLAIIALGSLSMDGLQGTKAPNKIADGEPLIERFNLQPARLSWKPQAAV